MNKTLLLFIFITICSISNAQKELWGINPGVLYQDNPELYHGNIIKYNIYGQNPTIIHEFDYTHGKLPLGKLFKASNGKLYGTTVKGGNSSNLTNPNIPFDSGYGVLFEYDLILDKYTVIYNFTNIVGYPQVGLIEPTVGVLYGTASNQIYKYNFITHTFTIVGGVGLQYRFSGDLTKASDGNLYGPFQFTFCGQVNPQPQFADGGIVKVNTATNTVSVAYGLACNTGANIGVATPFGKLIEALPGKLYGVTINGSVLNPDGTGMFTNGALFEYNFISNTFAKKKDFILNVEGKFQNEMTDGGDGNLYGTCSEGGNPICDNGETNIALGTLWKYSPATNTFTILKTFTLCNPLIDFVANPTSLMKTSNGYFMGTMPLYGLFKYDAVTNTIIQIVSNDFSPPELFNTINLIEICRKPSYQEIIINTFTPAVGSTFTYNIQNTNATTYVWKRGTTILPTQTTGTLTLTNVTTNDTGVYTCTMTNECGTTVTANLNVTVTNLATETVDTYKSEISLYPNPTKSIINLKFPENRGLKGIQYKITNLLGQVVQEAAIVAGKSQVTIDASAFPVGVYQVTLTTDKGDWNGKFVRE